MGYGISNIRTAAEAVATTKNWEFDFGFQQGINNRKTTKPFLSMIIPPSSESPSGGRYMDEKYDLEFLLYEAYPFSNTSTLDVLITTVRADLLAFCKALCTDTYIAAISSYKFQQLGNSNDQQKDVCVSVKFTVQVTNCI